MHKFLKILNFTDDEIITFKSEIDRLQNILKLDFISLDKAQKNVSENFDLSFNSIRLLLKELLLVILKDFKLLQSGEKEVIQMAIPMPNVVAAVINDLNPKKHITSSEYLIIYLSGILFNSYIKNEEEEKSYNCNSCGLNLSRQALYEDKNYLIPDGILSCMSYCDELHTTGEILRVNYDVNHYNYSIVNESSAENRISYLSNCIKNLIIEHSNNQNDNIEEVLKKYNNKRLEIKLLLGQINRIVAREKNAYVTFNEISLLNIFNLIHFDNMYEKAKIILNLFIKELKSKIRENDYIIENPIRLGCLHLPFTDPVGDRVFIKNGAAVIISSMYDGKVGNRSYHDEYERCIIPYLQKGSFGSIKEVGASIDYIIEKYVLDGFLFGQFEGDLALANFQPLIADNLFHKEKAYFILTQNWNKMDQHYYTKIENLVEVIKQRKEKNSCEY